MTVVNRDRWHAIRVRNYESDLSDVRVPLADVLEPIGVELVLGEVNGIDTARREIACRDRRPSSTLTYDGLVFTLGSELVRPAIPGLAEHGFDIDTYDAAARLNAHLAACPPSGHARPVHGARGRRRADRGRTGDGTGAAAA